MAILYCSGPWPEVRIGKSKQIKSKFTHFVSLSLSLSQESVMKFSKISLIDLLYDEVDQMIHVSLFFLLERA